MKTEPILALILLGTLTACQVDRSLPQQRFACRQGGVCRDASIRDVEEEPAPDAEEDGGVPDAGRDAGRDGGRDGGRDAGRLDATAPLTACSSPVSLPIGGLATGDTRQARDTIQGSCGVPSSGGRDIVYRFDLLSEVPRLDIRTRGSAFDTVLYLYEDVCAPAREIACDNDGALLARSSSITLSNAAAGRYYVAIDGLDAQNYGSYVLEVSATLPIDGPCNPDQPFLACAAPSVCTIGPGQSSFTCNLPLDCADGLDNDGDDEIDEDGAACDDPPYLACAPSATFDPGLYVTVPALPTSTFPLVDQQWSLISAPTDHLETLLISGHSDSAILIPELAGRYVTRYQAVDSRGQAMACESETEVRQGGDLLVELFWPEPQYADLDVHVLSPRADRFFDPAEDCDATSAACASGMLDWGTTGADQDPLSSGDILDPGPERVVVPQAELGTYRVAVHAPSAPEAALAFVRIHCKGAFKAELGPVALLGTESTPAEADVWKVADITFNAQGCTVTPLVDGQSDPLITTTREAEQQR